VLPGGLPKAFSDEFRRDAQKQTQWRAFVRKSRPVDVSGDLDAVIEEVSAFLMPVLEAAREERSFEELWPPHGPWGPRIRD